MKTLAFVLLAVLLSSSAAFFLGEAAERRKSHSINPNTEVVARSTEATCDTTGVHVLQLQNKVVFSCQVVCLREGDIPPYGDAIQAMYQRLDEWKGSHQQYACKNAKLELDSQKIYNLTVELEAKNQ